MNGKPLAQFKVPLMVIPPITPFTSPGASVDGDLTAAGVQSATVGTDAFSTVAAALAAVRTGGTVIINTATYAESPTTALPLVELRSYGATITSLIRR